MSDDDREDNMKVLSLQDRLDSKRKAELVRTSAERLGGFVNALGQVVLDPTVAIELAKLVDVFESQASRDTIPAPPPEETK
jgi:hypothetical protein